MSGGSEALVGGFCYIWIETGRQLLPLFLWLSLCCASFPIGFCYHSYWKHFNYDPKNAHKGFYVLIFSVSKQRYVLPHYRWTSNTPSSTVSISSSAMTANSTSVSHRKVFELFVLLLFSARIAVFLHSGFCPSRSNVKSGDTRVITGRLRINHWLHIVTTKSCYLLMVALKCQWPIFVKVDTTTLLKVEALSCSECFVKIPSAALFPESCTHKMQDECVAHFSITVTAVTFSLFKKYGFNVFFLCVEINGNLSKGLCNIVFSLLKVTHKYIWGLCLLLLVH